MAIPFSPVYKLILEQFERDECLENSALMNYYRNIFMNRFVWDNLPEEMPPDIIEKWLWISPAACWFRDEVLEQNICLPPAGWYKINVYWRPTRWRVIGGNGYNRELSKDECELIFNDPARTIPYLFIFHYVKKIENLESVADLNTDAQANPMILYTDTETELTSENVAKKFKKKAGIIKLKRNREGFNMEPKVLDTQVEFKVPQIQLAAQYYENKILKYLGIENVQVEKRERLITGEIDKSNAETQYNLAGALEMRQLAADKINKHFGLNISVRVRPKDEYAVDYDEEEEDEEPAPPGGENG